MTNSLSPHGLQHARLPYPPPTPDCSNLCPLSWWCHPTISSSVIPFSSCLQSFPASGSFPVSQSFASGGQSIGVPVAIPLAYRLCVPSQEMEGRFLWVPGAHLSCCLGVERCHRLGRTWGHLALHFSGRDKASFSRTLCWWGHLGFPHSIIKA